MHPPMMDSVNRSSSGSVSPFLALNSAKSIDSSAFVLRISDLRVAFHALPLLNRLHLALIGPGVFRQRPDQSIALHLLDDVRAPAGDSGHHEQRREEVDVEAHEEVSRAGGEIEIGVDL